jgi:hypothetical protein
MLAYERRIEGTIKEIYRLAKLNYTGGVSPSGIALAFEFEKTNQSLKYKAENLADAERKMANIVAKWENKESDAVIEYPKDFNLNDMERELNVALDALSLHISETFNKEYQKKLYRDLMPQLPSDKKTTIDDEINRKDELMDIEEAIETEG